MNEYQRVKHISERIERLLESVRNNNGNFSSIDKDILANYVRELYELIVSINPHAPVGPLNSTNNHVQESPPVIKKEEVKVKEEKPEQKIMNGDEIHSPSKETASKKSISEIYAGKKENGKTTVNEKFKKEGFEIADKLKQTPIKDLKAYIGLNKQFAFMSKLFNADEQFYEEAIARLNVFKTYEEAMGYIQSELLPKLNWSDDEPLVAEFFMLVMRRYLN
jgi:hypothetical protein